MPSIPFGLGSYARADGAGPNLRQVNMWLEKAPDGDRPTLHSMPGLVPYMTVGAGPIQGTFRQEGTFNGDRFTISGGNLYRGATLIGAVAGTGKPRWAASSSELVVTLGAQAYSYNGIDLAVCPIPDGYLCNSVDYAKGLFLFAANGTGRWYFSAVNDARTIGDLNFATAESEPDQLLDLMAIGDALYLAGPSSLEVWIYTGNAVLPYEPITNRTVDKGLIGRVCMEDVDNALHFVAEDAIVYRMAEVPQRISGEAMEERIRASATCSCFQFSFNGHSVFSIRLDSGTWAYDVGSQQFVEMATLLRSNFMAGCASQQSDQVVFGDDTTNALYTFGGWAHGASAMVREFSAWFPIKGGGVRIANLTVHLNPGETDVEAGAGADPVLEVRCSRDRGRTFGPWKPAKMGKLGDYRRRVSWRSLGLFDAPGALFHFRLLEPVPLSVLDVTVNEPQAGRGR
jgi:hypothetical protein